MNPTLTRDLVNLCWYRYFSAADERRLVKCEDSVKKDVQDNRVSGVKGLRGVQTWCIYSLGHFTFLNFDDFFGIPNTIEIHMSL